MTKVRFAAVQTDGGWAITDDQRWDDQYIMGHHGLTQEQTEYAAMLLNADAFGDTLDPSWHLGELTDHIWCAVAYTNCVECDSTHMQGTLDSSKRCTDCQS